MESRELLMGSSSFRYYREGNGPLTVLCFHGYGETGKAFGFLPEAAGPDFCFLAPDLPLHGETRWAEKGPFDETWLTTLVNTLLQAEERTGSRLILTWMSANRDDAVFGPDSERFDPDRERLNEHVAFGFGIHHCIGAPLSRLETRVALEELTQRIESFELCDDNRFEYHPSFFLRSLTRLDLVPQLRSVG